jgi:NAD(P)-dependent dehydrogenase (short-subunit alcohol dehydrogenase family)
MAELWAKGKVIVVTGASSGLGRALAMEAGRRAARVALLARRRELLDQLSKEISDGPGEAMALPADITEPDAVRKAFDRIKHNWGRIDILFNAAGVVQPVKRLESINDNEFITSLNINVLGIYIATRETVRHMLKQESGGTIINISSGAAVRPYVGWSMYGSQKAAVDMFTRIIALELENSPIRIAAVSPGPFESPMQEVLRAASDHDFPARDKFIGLYQSGELPTPELIAPMMLDISLTDWPELAGRVEDIRDAGFQDECVRHGVEIPEKLVQ